VPLVRQELHVLCAELSARYLSICANERYYEFVINRCGKRERERDGGKRNSSASARRDEMFTFWAFSELLRHARCMLILTMPFGFSTRFLIISVLPILLSGYYVIIFPVSTSGD